MPYFADDPGHWRERAYDARRLAATMPDATARENMNAVAEAYDRMADRALVRIVKRREDEAGAVEKNKRE